MKQELENLLILNEVDKKVYELQMSRKDLPLKIQALQEEIDTEKKKLEDIRAAIADTTAKIKENQTVVEDETAGLNASNEKLENISTNREYDAVHSEIATHKKNIDNAQANVIHFRQILENYQADAEKIEADFKDVIERNEPELRELTAELNGIEDKIAAEQARGKGPRENVNKRLLQVYDRLVKRRQTPYIIGFVNRFHRSCQSCNRTQTPQKINDISKMSNLTTCESCGAILVWKEDMERAD